MDISNGVLKSKRPAYTPRTDQSAIHRCGSNCSVSLAHCVAHRLATRIGHDPSAAQKLTTGDTRTYPLPGNATSPSAWPSTNVWISAKTSEARLAGTSQLSKIPPSSRFWPQVTKCRSQTSASGALPNSQRALYSDRHLASPRPLSCADISIHFRYWRVR